MGYAVYEEDGRWAGYGVPAECDFPSCHAQIDRGLAHKCETYIDYQYARDGQPIDPPESLTSDLEEFEVECEGCGLFFCTDHEPHSDHQNSEPKPDSIEWMRHMLTDSSWKQWRDENRNEAARMTDSLGVEGPRP